MRFSKLALLAAVGATAVVPVAADADSPRDRATGGGQIFLDADSQPGQGALDTLAFTAQRARGAASDSVAATGQVQVNRRSGTEDAQVKFHGVVTCLVVFGDKSQGEAYISGYEKGTLDDEDGPVPFELYVVDGGSGAAERNADQALVWYGAETEDNQSDDQTPGKTPIPEPEYCGIEDDPSSKRPIPALARGNYQVYDATPGPAPSAAAPAGLAGLAGL